MQNRARQKSDIRRPFRQNLQFLSESPKRASYNGGGIFGEAKEKFSTAFIAANLSMAK
jgi:hypothetical protein